MRPIGIDLFAGAGGLSLGFEQAGFDVAAAVEIDPVHCAIHKYNFPRTAILPRPVERLAGVEILAAAGIAGRRVDCVFGGAPCQGFSLIGHRALDDPRNGLVREFVRIVAELRARTFVFENVKGLTIGRHRAVLDELVEEFSDIGYDVRVPWRVLNTGHFGIPQYRERLILLGVRKGETLPDYPAPSTAIADGRQPVDGLVDGPTCEDALRDLPNANLFRTLSETESVRTSRVRGAVGLRGRTEMPDQRRLAFRVRARVGSLHPDVQRTHGAHRHIAAALSRNRSRNRRAHQPVLQALEGGRFQHPQGPAPTVREARLPVRGRSTTPTTAVSPCGKWPGCTDFRTGSDSRDEVARRTASRQCRAAAACQGDRHGDAGGSRRGSDPTGRCGGARRSFAPDHGSHDGGGFLRGDATA